MKITPQHEFTKTQKKVLVKARAISWISIIYLITVVVTMYLVMGTSQAMKTQWVDDILSLVPPISFLIGNHFCWKKPTAHYPYGFHRLISIFFLCAAISLFLMGGYLLVDSAIKLLSQERPTIGTFHFMGHDIWFGWLMLLVLCWSTFPSMILGHIKIKLAPKIHDTILYTDAKMNKADWLTGVVTMIGVIGIGIGWWWLDASAAIIISFDILHDGYKQTKNAVTDLINRAPKELNGEYSNLPQKIIDHLHHLTWVKKADVRIHEEGHLIFGAGFVSTNINCVTPKQIDDAIKMIEKLSWRLKSFTLTITNDGID